MIDMFLGVILLCDPNEVDLCRVVRGSFFETHEECTLDLVTSGLGYVADVYGGDVHIAYFECIPVELQGEPL